MGIPLHILIIEDSAEDAARLVRTLERGGYDVTWQVVDRREEMQQALARQPVDIVLSDHAMPSFSAPEALQVLRQAGLDTPFILVSGIAAEEVHRLQKELWAHDCVLKSELDGVLVPVIKRQLEKVEERRKRREGG
jgi:CheY-like chemotaxis protein